MNTRRPRKIAAAADPVLVLVAITAHGLTPTATQPVQPLPVPTADQVERGRQMALKVVRDTLRDDRPYAVATHTMPGYVLVGGDRYNLSSDGRLVLVECWRVAVGVDRNGALTPKVLTTGKGGEPMQVVFADPDLRRDYPQLVVHGQ